ncbi:hypothetical protein BCR43DRAFT_499286 [Syncephalastrum racemosum]|uniref:F-box domain-containing protein n=1 Tax=Syncephalastrum racemosum TaxID=13706 RepID=A0A1X2H034_SYNRA|nr:hypothetical protein BCR43DRAFT_499286 [Syncephalastrum racemosum]
MPSLNALLDNVAQSHRAKDYAQAETSIRDALHVILDLRAAEQMELGLLNSCLEHGLSLMELYPDAATGYTWCANVYSAKCNYKRAAELYALASERDPNSLELQQAAAQSLARTHCRLDPLLHLPNEVILKIFDFIPQMRVRCTRVSRAWRHHLLSLGSLWTTLSIYVVRKPNVGYWQGGLQRYLHPNLKHVNVSTNGHVCAILSLLIQADCMNIKKITLRDVTHYKPDSSADGRRSHMDISFLHQLSMLGHSLTHLRIGSSLRPRGLLCMLLTTLPCLEILVFRPSPDTKQRYTVPTWDDTYLSTPRATSLRHLEWMNHWDSDGMTEANFLAAYCPDLEYILLNSFGEALSPVELFAEIVQKNCHNLKQLTLGVTRIDRHLRDIGTRPDVHGVRYLTLNTQMPLNSTFAQDLLVQHEQTLEELHYISTPGVDFSTLRDTLHIQPPNLRWLAVAYSPLEGLHPLPAFITSCPRLETIQLDRVKLTPGLARALLQLPNLRTLSLSRCLGDVQSYLDFLEGVASLPHDQQRLEAFNFVSHNTSFDLNPILVATGALASVTHLRLCIKARSSKAALEEFLDNAAASGLIENAVYLDISVPGWDRGESRNMLEKAFVNTHGSLSKQELDAIHHRLGGQLNSWLSNDIRLI